MATLHGYILRELLKTFGLTLAALTVLFTMGGGVYNLIKYEGVSAADVFGFIPYLIPMAMTITMPIAAVFAAAMVYGRLAADNELLACRAAGINVHRLLLSAVLLSVFVALFTFVFANFIIPTLAVRIENFVRNNLRDLVADQLERKGFVQYREGDARHTLTAEKVQTVTESALLEKGFEVANGLHYLLVTNPSYTHLDSNRDLVRFAVATFGLIVFDTRAEPVKVRLLVRDARDFELTQRRAVVVGEQEIRAEVPPRPVTSRLAIAPLTDLLYWRQAPWEIPDVKAALLAFLDEITVQRFLGFARAQLEAGAELVLPGEYGREYRVQGTPRTGGKGLILTQASVRVTDAQRGAPTVYEAERAELGAAVLPTGVAPVDLELQQTANQPVLQYDPQAPDPSAPLRKPTLSLDGAFIPESILAEQRPVGPREVLGSGPLPLPERFDDRRAQHQKTARAWERKLAATLNTRLGFISSALVTVLMAAALGVIFREARVLAGVALSLIPFFTVGILMVLGSNLTKDAGTHLIGPFVTWGGLGLVAVADVVIVALGVRR
jgi:lipopolysaccharide export LptBFGC system permease protein LptF